MDETFVLTQQMQDSTVFKKVATNAKADLKSSHGNINLQTFDSNLHS